MSTSNNCDYTDIEFNEVYSDLFVPYRYKIYYGGRGGGKSWAIARALLLQGYERKLRILCTREIQHSITDSVHKLLSEQIDALGLTYHYTITQQTISGANGTEFIFKGLHANVREIKSTEGVDICWVEEAASVSEESWEVLIPTIRTAGSEIWLTFNPVNETDPTYQRFVANTPPNSAIHKVSWRENPYFPDVLKAEKDYLERIDRDLYLHIWEGEVQRISNAIIFKDKYAVEEFETPDNARFYHGCDWGFSSDPTALVRCFVQGRRLYIDMEAYGVGVELDETAALFDSIPTARKWPIKADSARPETISYMRRQGFNITAAKKWHGSVEDGIAFLKSFEKIIVHPRCKHTIDELDHYSYKIDKQTGDILPVIIDAHNHCLVPGTMVLTERGNKPIEEITTADKVLTRQGYKPVLWAGESDRDRTVFKVQTEGGRFVIGTANHKIYTQRGFVCISELKENDEVLVCQNLENLLLLKCTATNGGATPTPQIEPIRNTTSADVSIYTILFGNISMAQGVKDTLSTIKTGIAKTTIFRTLKKLRQKNTAQNDTPSQKNGASRQDATLSSNRKKPKNGTEVKLGANGIFNTLKFAPTNFQTFQKFIVQNVEYFLSQRLTTKGSVQTPVKAGGAEMRGWITSQKPANCAARNLSQTNTAVPVFVVERVLQLTEVGCASKVFDITVDCCHEFFANGILVHNCMDSLRYALDGLIQGKTPMRINPNILKRGWK